MEEELIPAMQTVHGAIIDKVTGYVWQLLCTSDTEAFRSLNIHTLIVRG